MSRQTSFIALALLPVATVLLTACADDKAAPSAAAKPTTPTKATTPASPAPSSPPAAQPPSIASAADGRKLSACRDGECEVVIKAGDVLRFGAAVKAKPRLDSLMVVGVSGEGAIFVLPSGTTTTANGTIEINNALRIEVGVPKRSRVAVRISLVR